MPRLHRSTRALLVLVPLLLVAALGAVLVWRTPQPPQPYRQLIGELGRLIGDNGLYVRPGLTADGKASWSASAHGLSALVTATGRHVRLNLTTAHGEALAAQAADDPLWTAWFGVQVEHAGNVIIPGGWAEAAVTQPITATSPAEQIASIAAIAEVSVAKALPIPEANLADFTQRLHAAVAATQSPFSQCRAQQAAAALKIRTEGWRLRVPQDTALGHPASTEQMMNVYGVLCLAELLHRPLETGFGTRIRQWLETYLNLNVAGAEMEAHYLARAWIMAGGRQSHLSAMATRLTARAEPASGLLREHVIRIGTLENTYHVALLADMAGAAHQIIGEHTRRAVHDLLREFRQQASAVDLLMCAVILKLAGFPDQELESDAVTLAVGHLAQGVQRANVTTQARIVALLQQLGRDIPKLTAAPFAVTTDEDLFLAWTMLGLAHHTSNSHEVRQGFALQASLATTALNTPNELMAREVTAALVAAGTRVDPNRLPVELTDWATAVRGCNGFKALYRPAVNFPQCTLEATVQIQAAGLSDA